MRTISENEIKHQINNCYDAYDPGWPASIGRKDIMKGFKYHLEHTAGIKLDFELDIRNGKMGYKINSIEIVDESSFLMWALKWA
jgi:hypothetical protein